MHSLDFINLLPPFIQINTSKVLCGHKVQITSIQKLMNLNEYILNATKSILKENKKSF